MHYFLLRRETGAQRHEELQSKKLPRLQQLQTQPAGVRAELQPGRAGPPLWASQHTYHDVGLAECLAALGETISRLIPVADRTQCLAAVVLRSPILVD